MSGPLTTYNTAIISKPFSPLQFTGLELWLRGDHGVIADSNERVSEWRDYSGKDRHVTQATAGQQPLRLNAAKAGLPALQFTSTRQDVLESTTATGIDDCSIFVAIRVDSTDSTEDVYIAIAKGNDQGRCRFLYRPGSSANINFATWGNDFTSGTIGWDTGNFHAVGSILNGASVTILRDSLIETANLGSNPVATSQNYWGIGATSQTGFGSYYSNCSIGEVIIYNRAVNITERQQILTYLRNKWQTPD